MRLAFAISVALTGAGQAQDLGPVPVPVQSVRPSQRVIDCYCTDRSGSRVELGETICLTVDGRAFLARCEMSLNVPMWRETGEACVGAGWVGPGRAGHGGAGHGLAFSASGGA